MIEISVDNTSLLCLTLNARGFTLERKHHTTVTSVENTSLREFTLERDQPYHCDQCGKHFTQRIHTGERQTIPLQCGEHFTQRIHTGDQPHCDQCGKHFTLKEHLKTLQRIHTGKRPYRFPVWKTLYYNVRT